MDQGIAYTCKFGGSSLADAERVQRLATFLREERFKPDFKRRFIVVSAPGKRGPDDHKVTDLLYHLYETAKIGQDVEPLFKRIHERFYDVALGLDRTMNRTDALYSRQILDRHMQEIRKEFPNQLQRPDWIASRGEWLMAQLLSACLYLPFVDATDIIRFTSGGKLDSNMTQILACEKLCASVKFASGDEVIGGVVPGFYGMTPEGDVKTFSRGGSDLTGALVAQATGSVLYENFTDVDGLMSADPRIVSEAKSIREVTYRELRELSYMGASVFHEEAVAPARLGGIRIHIRNTFDMSSAGTQIMHEAHRGEHPLVVGVAGRKGFSVIQVRKLGMNEERGFMRRMLWVLADEEVNVEHSPGGIDSLSVIVPTEDLKDREETIKEEIMLSCKPDEVEIDHGLALIATVGHGMWNKPGVAGRLTTALGEAGVNIKMINQGSSELNIIVGVAESDFERAIQAIHKEFF